GGGGPELFRERARVGLARGRRLHPQTSQYGTLSRGPSMLPEDARDRLRAALDGIRSGRFAAEWRAEQARGYPVFSRLRREAEAHAINAAEVLGRDMLARCGLLDE